MISIYSYRLVILVSIFIVSTALTSLDVFAQGDVINACFSNQNGNLRIVANQNECKKFESPLSWNVQGPQGPEGPSGVSGLETVTSSQIFSVLPSFQETHSVECPVGKSRIGGSCECNQVENLILFECPDCAITRNIAGFNNNHSCTCANHGTSAINILVRAEVDCAFVD